MVAAPFVAYVRGFPALAGMDLQIRKGLASATRLPRARGDGPVERAGHLSDQRASPRSRGWTLACPPIAGHQRGFPALAGMDPEDAADARRGDRLLINDNYFGRSSRA